MMRTPTGNSYRGHRVARGAVSLRLVIGLLIIGLGAIFLASNLGFLDAHRPLRFFLPLACLAIGLSLIVEQGGRRRSWGWIWVGVGIWSFAYQQAWIDVDFWDVVFPTILLFVGARLVTRAVQVQNGTMNKPQTRVYAFLSGHETRSVPSPFKEAEVVAVMGGIKLDLTHVQMQGDSATLDVTVVMGGVEIYAPPDWNMINQVLPLLGAAEDKRRPTAVVPTKTLTVRGTVLMGGLEIKN